MGAPTHNRTPNDNCAHRQEEERYGSGLVNMSLLTYMRDRTWPTKGPKKCLSHPLWARTSTSV